MERIFLTDIEKEVLRKLNVSSCDADMFSEFPNAEVHTAFHRLNELGLIQVAYQEGYEIADARILEKGKTYLIVNPNLENPFDEDELKRLQKDNLEYQQSIRKYEDVIRFHKFLSAILGLIALAGWFFSFFK